VHFKSLRWLLAVAALLAAWSANATLIYTTTYGLSNADPTQQGRLVRSGTPQDWSMSLAYPGQNNTGVNFHYQTFTLDLDGLMAGFSFGQYLQVIVDYGTGTTDFVSAYLDSYNPANKGAGWLGDTGFSGNDFGNPGYFQIIAGSGHDLVLLLNDTAGGSIAGTKPGVTIMVEAYTDTMYSDLTRNLPEPAALALVAVALAAAMGSARRRRNAA